MGRSLGGRLGWEGAVGWSRCSSCLFAAFSTSLRLRRLFVYEVLGVVVMGARLAKACNTSSPIVVLWKVLLSARVPVGA